MNKIVATAATVLSVVSFLAMPVLAEKCTESKDSCSPCKAQCSASQEKCGAKEDCGRKARHHRAHKRSTLGRISKRLDLSKEQQEKAAPIAEKYDRAEQELRKAQHEAFQNVLTAEQKASLEQAGKEKGEGGHKAGRGHGRHGKAPIELTQEQKDTLKASAEASKSKHEAAFENFKKELAPILSGEQKAELDKLSAKDLAGHGRHHGHHGRRGHGGPGMPGGPGMHGAPGMPGGHGMMGLPPEAAKDLGITEAQKTKIEAIMAKHREAGKERFEAMRKADMADMKAMKDEIDAVLTSEQKAKLEKMFKEGPKCGKGMPDGRPGFRPGEGPDGPVEE